MKYVKNIWKIACAFGIDLKSQFFFFYYLTYFYYYLWVILHFLVLFISHAI